MLAVCAVFEVHVGHKPKHVTYASGWVSPAEPLLVIANNDAHYFLPCHYRRWFKQHACGLHLLRETFLRKVMWHCHCWLVFSMALLLCKILCDMQLQV